MPPHSDPANDLTDLERCLAGWQPSRTGLDADRMLYAAGRASARPRLRLWASLAGLMTLVALLLTGVLIQARMEQGALSRQLAEVREQQIRPEPEAPASSPEPGASNSYLHVRNLLLQGGVEAWPTLAPGDKPAPKQPPGEPIWHVGQRWDLIEY